MVNDEEFLGSPLFITGNAAAGTTLVRNLLDGHDDLMVFPVEMNLRAFMCEDGTLKTDFELDEFFSTGPTTGINSLRFNKATLDSGARDYGDIDFELFKKQVERQWDEKTPRSLQVEVIRSFKKYSALKDLSPKLWLEKTHGNEQFIDTFFDWYPRTKIIHIVRDPFDNFCSYRNKSEKKGGVVTPFIFSVQWASSLQNVLMIKRKKPRQVMIVRYENLLTKPQSHIEKICKFLDIPYSDKLLMPTTYGVAWSGNSQEGTKFSGISKKPIGTHIKKGLTKEEISILNFSLGSYRSFLYFTYPQNIRLLFVKLSLKELAILLLVRMKKYNFVKKIVSVFKQAAPLCLIIGQVTCLPQ